MKFRDGLELLTLAALWGGSFLFMRILAPLVGAFSTATLRMLFGAGFLAVVLLTLRSLPSLRHLRTFVVVGLVNSALPFALYSLGALYLPASVEVVLNALGPVFAAFAGWLFLGERLGLHRLLGLGLGVIGVLVVIGGLNLGTDPLALLAFGGCLMAPVAYAFGGVLVKKLAGGTTATQLAFGSQLWGGLLLLPSVFLTKPEAVLVPGNLGLLVLFGVLCSGLAYVLYYGLMKRIGPSRTLSVTFLMPLFGVLWGALFLGEAVTLSLVLGGLLILFGTGLTTLSFKKATGPRVGPSGPS